MRRSYHVVVRPRGGYWSNLNSYDTHDEAVDSAIAYKDARKDACAIVTHMGLTVWDSEARGE